VLVLLKIFLAKDMQHIILRKLMFMPVVPAMTKNERYCSQF